MTKEELEQETGTKFGRATLEPYEIEQLRMASVVWAGITASDMDIARALVAPLDQATCGRLVEALAEKLERSAPRLLMLRLMDHYPAAVGLALDEPFDGLQLERETVLTRGELKAVVTLLADTETLDGPLADAERSSWEKLRKLGGL